MKFITEKEKKLQDVLTKLKEFKASKNEDNLNFKALEEKKNQLEIEKKEIENKYIKLENDFNQIKLKIDLLNNKNQDETRREKEFDNKIDELNQETDTLLEEIEKWQI
tara:strand:+ start:132 stop:455 length:324 start_codon:yes stop_codon:yes gene_type:complete